MLVTHVPGPFLANVFPRINRKSQLQSDDELGKGRITKIYNVSLNSAQLFQIQDNFSPTIHFQLYITSFTKVSTYSNN